MKDRRPRLLPRLRKSSEPANNLTLVGVGAKVTSDSAISVGVVAANPVIESDSRGFEAKRNPPFPAGYASLGELLRDVCVWQWKALDDRRCARWATPNYPRRHVKAAEAAHQGAGTSGDTRIFRFTAHTAHAGCNFGNACAAFGDAILRLIKIGHIVGRLCNPAHCAVSAAGAKYGSARRGCDSLQVVERGGCHCLSFWACTRAECAHGHRTKVTGMALPGRI